MKNSASEKLQPRMRRLAAIFAHGSRLAWEVKGAAAEDVHGQVVATNWGTIFRLAAASSALRNEVKRRLMKSTVPRAGSSRA